MSLGQLTPGIWSKMYFPSKFNFRDFVKKLTCQMMGIIFHHGAKENAIFYSKGVGRYLLWLSKNLAVDLRNPIFELAQI